MVTWLRRPFFILLPDTKISSIQIPFEYRIRIHVVLSHSLHISYILLQLFNSFLQATRLLDLSNIFDLWNSGNVQISDPHCTYFFKETDFEITWPIGQIFLTLNPVVGCFKDRIKIKWELILDTETLHVWKIFWFKKTMPR